MKNQKGFSLIELLVVVIIIAIIAAIAIPSLLASRRAANQSTAVANLRTISSAAATYASLNGGAYPATFTDMSGGTAQYLDGTWVGTTNTRSGYDYDFEASSTAGTGFCVEAAPTSASDGDFGYSISHRGVIYELAAVAPAVAVAPACAADTGTISTGAVLGN